MTQKVNEKYEQLFSNPGKARYVILMGGRGAGRSTVASQYAASKLVAPEFFRCAIMRYVLGDIRNSIYREITDRAEENGIMDLLDVNDSMMVLGYGANSINAVGFKKSSGDQKAKLKSLANYTTVIIEEADEIPEADFVQLDDSLRTLKGEVTIILLLNPPPRSSWIIKRWFDLLPSGVEGFYVPQLKPEATNALFIRTSFEDNIRNLNEQSVANYRAYEQTKPDHYWNMIRGLVPEVVKGRIFSGWQVIDDIPFEARLERFGLDFGYSNDPTAIVAVWYHNGGYIVDEVAYSPGLSNREIAAILTSQNPSALTVADSAEPKSIDELRGYQVQVVAGKKGPGSVNQGIQYVQSKPISVTRRSVNVIEEYENYAWLVDKEDNTLNVPKPGYDHAMDALRYALSSIRNPEQVSAHVHYPSAARPRSNLPGGALPPGAGNGVGKAPGMAYTHVPRL